MGPPKMSYPTPQTPWIWWDNSFIESCYVTWHHWAWNWKVILGYLRRCKVIPWVLKSREFSLADGREVRNIQSIVTTVVLQLERVIVLSHFSQVQLFVTLQTKALQAPLSMGMVQARILEWVAVPSSRESSWPRDQTFVSYVSCIGRWVLYHKCHPGSPLNVVSGTIYTTFIRSPW